VGTGGTLAGVAMALKERNPKTKIYLADPPGSAIYNYYAHGELKAEGTSITEGIGQGRITRNLEGAPIDGWFHVSDEEMLPVLFALVQEEGLILGGSTGVNICGALKAAKELGPGHVVVTVLADYGTRYQSKLFNPAFLRERKLPVPKWLDQ
jgi:cysteine synthase A